MELLECLFFILLFYGINSKEILEDEYRVFTFPKFSWLNNRNIQVTFPNGLQDNMKLRTADKIGNMIVPCLYEGVLLKDNSSSVAVSGCQHDDLVNIVMYTSHLPKHNMFTINNGTTREAEKINFDKTNTRGGTKRKQRLRKRGAYLEDGDYDELDFDGSDPPQPPPFLSLTVKLAFEDSLLTEKKTEVAAREYIARVFTLGKQHFQHASLGTKIRLRAQGPIRRIPGKSWNPSRQDIIEARQFKDPEEIPITFFCYNQDRNNDVGIAYRREACHEQKGVSIVAARADIQKAAQSYSHETGHWLGLPHDMDLSVECEGQGIMSRIDTPGGRPSKWSHCNQRKFSKWYHKDNRKYSQCLKEDGEVLQMESSCLASSYETVVPFIPKCDTVVVSGADYANCSGEYKVSGERVAWSPSKSVYAHISLDRYIYWNVRGHGWSIGNMENTKTGAYLHYSGLDSSEPWEASWRNGITVVCKGAGSYFDDLVLLAPTRSSLQSMMTICADYDQRHNIVFIMDPNPIKSKTKCLFFKSKNGDEIPLPIYLNGQVEHSDHLGNELHTSRIQELDCNMKRGAYIGETVELLGVLHDVLVHPLQKLTAIQTYARSFYGSSLFDLYGPVANQLFCSCQISLRDACDLPIPTRN